MWFRKCIGVLALQRPVPSMLIVTSTLVSFVSLLTRPLRRTGAAASVLCAAVSCRDVSVLRPFVTYANEQARNSSHQLVLCLRRFLVLAHCQAEQVWLMSTRSRVCHLVVFGFCGAVPVI